MKLFTGGTRGTRAVADMAFARFGGDTSCFLVTGAAGEQAIVDAGTGLRSVAAKLAQDETAPIRFFFTHWHLDHLAGLFSFAPLYREGRCVNIAAPQFDGVAPASVVGALFAPPFWPVPLAALQARIGFSALSDEPAALTVGGLHVRWCPVRHPGGCLAYRFDEPGTEQALVIATDMEWATASARERAAFLRFCRTPRPADLLLMDGQFTPDHYEPFRGWGHSRWSDGVEVARLADAGALAVIHHDPNSPDTRLDTVERDIQRAWPNAFLLKQGTELDLSGPLAC